MADRAPTRGSDRLLPVAAVVLVVVLALVLLGTWLAARPPAGDPVPVPSVSRA